MVPGLGGSGTGGSNGPAGDGTDGGRGTGPVNDTGATPGNGGTSLVATVMGLLPMIVVTAGGAAMLMAFLVFGKRRRHAEQPVPDEALAASAATGLGYVPNPGLRAAPVPVSAAQLAAAAAAVTAVAEAVGSGAGPEIDAHLPRWRRPSLMEARKADPARDGGVGPEALAASRLTFDGRVSEAVSGLERRRIRYRMVSLLDMPDEIRGVEIGSLDEGDEVVMLEKRGTYWRVLCPNGSEGWLHKMTLGDVVIATTGTAESWTSADEGPAVGSFEDVLRAYSDLRQPFGGALPGPS
ncbi:MAG TPA: SH3 domain-containing protein [Candidatus Limnocylindrales bacterium]|nr:SH3 domain-containing protein [Candidatus Limnocylindrales bacterium]